MMTKPNHRGDTPVTEGSARVKVWTGLGTVMLAGAALSLAPSVLHAGLLDKAAKPAPAPRRHSSSPSTVTKVAKAASAPKAVRVGRVAKAVNAVKAARAAKAAKAAKPVWPRSLPTMTWLT